MTKSREFNFYDRLDTTFTRANGRTSYEVARTPSRFFDTALPAADKLRDPNFQDPLTGLLNRRGFERELEIWKETQLDGDACLALAYIDLNNFKTVNDEFGHSAGDRALIDIANVLRESLRSSDMIARWGGDEIVLGLPVRASPEEVSHEEIFATLDEKLNGSLQQAQRVMAMRGEPVGYLQNLSFAIGVEIYPASALDFALDELLNKPDERMYEHKRKLKSA